MYILGVDASLTSTGIAWLDTDTREWVTDRVKTHPFDGSHWYRMQHVGLRVLDAAVGGAVHLVVIEGLATYGHNAGLLAGLWWQIVGPLEDAGLEVLTVPPATRAKYATGKGNAGKSDVLAAVRATHPDADVPGHDIADAVSLAALGARIKGFPVEASPQPWHEDVAASVRLREQEREQ